MATKNKKHGGQVWEKRPKECVVCTNVCLRQVAEVAYELFVKSVFGDVRHVQVFIWVSHGFSLSKAAVADVQTPDPLVRNCRTCLQCPHNINPKEDLVVAELVFGPKGHSHNYLFSYLGGHYLLTTRQSRKTHYETTVPYLP